MCSCYEFTNPSSLPTCIAADILRTPHLSQPSSYSQRVTSLPEPPSLHSQGRMGQCRPILHNAPPKLLEKGIEREKTAANRTLLKQSEKKKHRKYGAENHSKCDAVKLLDVVEECKYIDWNGWAFN